MCLVAFSLLKRRGSALEDEAAVCSFLSVYRSHAIPDLLLSACLNRSNRVFVPCSRILLFERSVCRAEERIVDRGRLFVRTLIKQLSMLAP